MGIHGLHKCLQSITRPTSLEEYRGLTVAIDAMSWLHKGVFAGDVRSLAIAQFNAMEDESCRSERKSIRRLQSNDHPATKLDFDVCAKANNSSSMARSEFEPDAAVKKCVEYVIRNAQKLRRDFGMKVVMVIDGDSLPAKSETDKKRRIDRQTSYKEALSSERRGNTRHARRLFARSCSITQEMRRYLTLRCEDANISFLVAPYEADAQLAKLAHSGSVDLIITEDSDLLAYECPRVLFKLDLSTCCGEEIQLMRDLGKNFSPSFKNWTHEMFIYMCVISGCDYSAGLPGIGIKTAHKLVCLHRTPAKIFNALKSVGRLPAGYEESFWIGYRTFRHQRIFCPQKQQIEFLTPIQRADYGKTIFPFLGPWLEQDIAIGIAMGTLHPVKKVPWKDSYDQHNPFSFTSHQHSTLPRLSLPSNVSFPGDENQLRSAVADDFVLDDCQGLCGGHAGLPADSCEANPCPHASSEQNMFAFFRPKKGRGRAKTSEAREHPNFCPPLKEVHIETFVSHRLPDSDYHESGTDHNDRNFEIKGCYQPIPVHFKDYSSKLVGESFQTLSRRRRKKRSREDRNATTVINQLNDQGIETRVASSHSHCANAASARPSYCAATVKINEIHWDSLSVNSEKNNFTCMSNGVVSSKQMSDVLSGCPVTAVECKQITGPQHHFDYSEEEPGSPYDESKESLYHQTRNQLLYDSTSDTVAALQNSPQHISGEVRNKVNAEILPCHTFASTPILKPSFCRGYSAQESRLMDVEDNDNQSFALFSHRQSDSTLLNKGNVPTHTLQTKVTFKDFLDRPQSSDFYSCAVSFEPSTYPLDDADQSFFFPNENTVTEPVVHTAPEHENDWWQNEHLADRKTFKLSHETFTAQDCHRQQLALRPGRSDIKEWLQIPEIGRSLCSSEGEDVRYGRTQHKFSTLSTDDGNQRTPKIQLEEPRQFLDDKKREQLFSTLDIMITGQAAMRRDESHLVFDTLHDRNYDGPYDHLRPGRCESILPVKSGDENDLLVHHRASSDSKDLFEFGRLHDVCARNLERQHNHLHATMHTTSVNQPSARFESSMQQDACKQDRGLVTPVLDKALIVSIDGFLAL